jgi:alcohol dehydrogenase class IV
MLRCREALPRSCGNVLVPTATAGVFRQAEPGKQFIPRRSLGTSEPSLRGRALQGGAWERALMEVVVYDKAMRTTWTFASAGQLIFGTDAVAQLGELAARHGYRRVLIITDPPLVAAGLLDRIRQPLSKSGIEVELFDGGEPEPSFRIVGRAMELARRFQPDVLLGLGGGSNIDLAKMLSVVIAHGGDARSYIGDNKVPGPVTPIIAVPTTAGTGSEISASCVMTDDVNQIKVGVLSHFMRPRLAVVDPKLTLSCPRKVTADSGIDALTHAIEAFTAVDNERFDLPAGETSIYQGRNPMGDMIAERAIALAGRHLVRAVNEPENLDARTGMALAATLAGLAFSNVGVALVHALEYPLGGAVHCSHGAGNGLLLPYVMWFNLPGREAEFARIATLLGRDTRGMAVKEAAEEAIRAVEEIRIAIGIPTRLRDLGVRDEQLPVFAEKALGIKRILRVNPRQPTKEDLIGILAAAW